MSLNMKELMEKAKAMQEKIQEAQQKVENLVSVGEAGGGIVKVHMNGAHKLLRTEIDPAILKNTDLDMLSDLFTAAVNNAVMRIDKASKQEMMGFAKDMDLPLPEDET